MIYFAGIKNEDGILGDGGKLRPKFKDVRRFVSKDRQISIGKPLTIEWLSVQLSNLDLESKKDWLGGERKDKFPLQPIIISECVYGDKQIDGTWKRPKTCHLHYDSVLKIKNKHVTRSEMDRSNRSPLVHHIPVYEGQRVKVTLSIYEVDEFISEETKEAIGGIFGLAGAIFLPYSAAIFGAGKLFETFINLHNDSIEHDEFLKQGKSLKWSPKDTTFDHVSTCYMICVQDNYPSGETIDPPFDITQWKLNDDYCLIDGANNKLEDRCYTVLYISNRELRPAEQQFVSSQKAATLLAEIERQKNKPDGHLIVLKELLETEKNYSTMKNIQRILELKANLGSLSNDDKAKLKGYLNIPSIKVLEFYDALKKDVNSG